ncbi:MAG TPA: lycopene cyclase domain-containing protein [Bacteroidia bacterium]|jgi:lycopene cyclase domain-containing protein
MKQFTYLFLLIFTLSYPLYKSFEGKIAYHKKWKTLFPAILLSAVIFISWDIWFTSIGVWEFNEEYVLGIFLLNLPLEEWLFFFIVPFSCVFIYEVMNYFVPRDVLAPYVRIITFILIAFLALTAFFNTEKIYTFISFISLASFLLLHLVFIRSAYLGRYYLAWLICTLPFLLVNGVLTAMPVLIYNNPDNLNIRIYTIPVEDLFYGMLQFLLVITVYEYLKIKDK